MKFTELNLSGAYLIEFDEHIDERGAFLRQFCTKEFNQIGIDFNICQCNISKNNKKNTIRGMHYQKEPYSEAKIVSCIKGKLYDVFVDLREDSPTYLKWDSVELYENDNRMLYIPKMFAHGFQTLEDNTFVYYQMGEYYNSESASGLRYNDPKLNIQWKEFKYPPIMNERDKNYKLL